MQILEVNGFTARCAAKGTERDVSLLLLQDEPLAPGDFIMIHLGYAIQKMTPQEAYAAWELYDQMFAADA